MLRWAKMAIPSSVTSQKPKIAPKTCPNLLPVAKKNARQKSEPPQKRTLHKAALARLFFWGAGCLLTRSPQAPEARRLRRCGCRCCAPNTPWTSGALPGHRRAPRRRFGNLPLPCGSSARAGGTMRPSNSLRYRVGPQPRAACARASAPSRRLWRDEDGAALRRPAPPYYRPMARRRRRAGHFVAAPGATCLQRPSCTESG